MYKLIILLSIAALVTTSSFAGPSFPRRCEPNDLEFRDSSLILNPGGKSSKAEVFLFYNQSQKPLVIEHPQAVSNLFNTWKNTLDRNKWAALVLDKDDFNLVCSSKSKKDIYPVPCADALKACKFTYSNIELSSKGSYWAIKSEKLRRLRQRLRKKGVHLPK